MITMFIFLCYFLISILATFVGLRLTDNIDGVEGAWDWKLIFIFQRALYKYIKNELNIVGIIISEIIITILTLGASMIYFFVYLMVTIVASVSVAFCYLFSKNK